MSLRADLSMRLQTKALTKLQITCRLIRALQCACAQRQFFLTFSLDRVAQLVGHLTRKSEALSSIPGLVTFVSPSGDSRGAVVSYWRKNVHEVLVNCLGGLSLPRKSVVRLTDRLDMTLDVYGGRKITTTHTHT